MSCPHCKCDTEEMKNYKLNKKAVLWFLAIVIIVPTLLLIIF